VTPPASPGEARLWPLGQGLDLVADKVEAFGGAVIARRAAELDAAFGLEPAEDAPSRAANAALAIQKQAERLRGDDGGSGLLMALDIATCTLTLVAGAVAPAPEAWRVIDRALEGLLERGEPDTIVVSAATAALLQRRFTLEPVDETGPVPTPTGGGGPP
jgi:hypothetical protein